MKINCPVLLPNNNLPPEYTCMGKNINPPLEFENIPKNAKSLVLIFEDLDAKPVPWVHWLVFNIPPITLKTAAGEVPSGGILGIANNKSYGYEGPCGKYFNGIHRYRFRLLALDHILKIPEDSDKDAVLSASQKFIINEAVLNILHEGTLSDISLS